jgi:hypothetical protein
VVAASPAAEDLMDRVIESRRGLALIESKKAGFGKTGCHLSPKIFFVYFPITLPRVKKR